MLRFAAASAALLASTALVHAGGVERNAFTTGILFEEGTYFELAYSYADPSLSGEQTFDATASGAPPGSVTGDIAPAYGFTGLAYRQDLTDSLSFAFTYDEPIGADVDYEGIGAPPGYLYRFGTGSQAEIRAQQYTAMLRYETEQGISLFGGLRAVTANGNVSLFTGSGGTSTTNYVMEADGSAELGYLVGAAYEIPEIALRVSLTYIRATTHAFDAQETTALGTADTEFETTIPQQILLEAQTGVAEGTLAFGSIRWVDWSEFEIAPPVFVNAPSNPNNDALVSYDNDSITYTLGGARRLSETLALLGSVSYEHSQGGFSGNLGPTDGRTTVGLAARYDINNVRITAGASYTWVGDAQTEAPFSVGGTPGDQFAVFEDNTAIAFGLRIGYSF